MLATGSEASLRPRTSSALVDQRHRNAGSRAPWRLDSDHHVAEELALIWRDEVDPTDLIGVEARTAHRADERTGVRRLPFASEFGSLEDAMIVARGVPAVPVQVRVNVNGPNVATVAF
jgi:hypothetical protein